MEQTEAWLARIGEALGIKDTVASQELLATTRQVAHRVSRPAAPLTTYLIGVAVARGMSVSDAVSAVERCIDESQQPGAQTGA